MFLQQITILCIISLTTIKAHLDTQIAGGHNAPDGKYPFQVSIQYKNKHICSGSIIDKRHILTSRSCLMEAPANVSLVAGTNSLTAGGQKFNALEYFDYLDPAHNIALIRTRQNIDFNDKVQPIAITNKDYREPGYPVTFLSWERANNSGQVANDKLQEIKKKLYDQDECQSLYENVGEQDLCTAGESGENDCDVNLGSPIIADGVQIGIRTAARCGPNVVARNVRVYYYRDWISDNTDVEL